MGLYGVLGSALSGLRVTQAGLDVVARNVANADTPGYTKKTLGQSTLVVGSNVTGIRMGDITRDVDMLVQRQIRQENSGLGYIRILQQYYGQLDLMMGEPGSPNGIDSLFNTFRTSLENLATSPDLVHRPRADAARCPGACRQPQPDVRRHPGDAPLGRAADRRRGVAGQRSARKAVQDQPGHRQPRSGQRPPADLLDIRDNYINELSELMDIRVIERDRGVVTVFTQSGTMLLDADPAKLTFDERGTVTAQSLYSEDPSESGVGSIKIIAQNGSVIDLIQDKQIRSRQARRTPGAARQHPCRRPAQLDDAGGLLARALSGRDVEGTAAASGAQNGFDIDLSGMLPGDRSAFR